eukprot:TRINITY_DN4101_c0_g1_i1.p1 TRINITY_DN4101_c0_g1~~TRINITY_DN4101_c0_g1_i1.p1  ORF type:complete len:271 (-),score=104.07 TRINITY_DN4101_c0_g1_i1:71-883(-)
MQEANSYRKKLESGEKAIGIWQMYPAPSISRSLARIPGLNWILIDCEHGNMDDASMHEAIANISPYGPSPLVRIPDAQGWMIKRALDAGAHGIMVPLVSTKETAEYIVEQSKFPPRGKRGFGSPFSMTSFGLSSAADYLRQANDSTVVIVQIETEEAVNNVEAIAAVDGIDVIFIGPIDLSNFLGHPLAYGEEHPKVTQAIDRILKAAHKAGKKAGIFTGNPEDAKRRAEQGFDMVNLGTDVANLVSNVVQGLQKVQNQTEVAPAKGGGY